MEETKYQGRFIKITEEVINEQVWERAYLSDGVMVYPITEDGKIIMIEEKRPHEKRPIRLKFVTGLIDNNEDPLKTANREMQEEIGYKASQLKLLIHRSSSGTVNNNFYQVIAKGLTPSKIPNPDGEETIVAIKEFSLDQLFELLRNGDIPWSMGALGLFKIKEENLI